LDGVVRLPPGQLHQPGEMLAFGKALDQLAPMGGPDVLRGEGQAHRQVPGKTAGAPAHLQAVLRNRQALDHLGVGVRRIGQGGVYQAQGIGPALGAQPEQQVRLGHPADPLQTG